MPKSVTVYTTQGCPYCHRAKNLLQRKGIAFQEVDLTEDAKKRQELQDRYNWMSVPIILIGEKFIGGANELDELERTGELSKYL